jgi:putative ABC transport system permease protein
MNIITAFRIALNALIMHKGRSALTSLGIIIGTGAVISMVSAAGGARTKLDERLDNVGKTLIIIRAGARTQNGTLADIKPLTNEEATALRKQLRSSTAGLAEVQATVRIASTSTRNAKTMIVGTSPDMQKVRSWVVQHGRFLVDEDLKKQAAVCVIGQTVREALFPDTPNPVGQTIRIDRLQLRIVGVVEGKGRSPIGGDQDDQIFLPLSTVQRKLVGDEILSMLLTSVDSVDKLDKTKQDVSRILREKRRLKPGLEDFDVSSVQEMAEIAIVMTRTMQFLIGIIASISLIVGGIGIMNIMLVSVTERTREIGIRMAIGATPADILTQFLIEAVLLSLLGGLIGITLGVGAAIALAWAAKWPIFVDYTMVVLSFAISGSVGVFFGYYPALKASRLDPIEALRYE